MKAPVESLKNILSDAKNIVKTVNMWCDDSAMEWLIKTDNEIKRLTEIVGKLPITADGVQVVPWLPTVLFRCIQYHKRSEIQQSSGFGNGSVLFEPLDDNDPKSHGYIGQNISLCYSSREAAEVAERE